MNTTVPFEEARKKITDIYNQHRGLLKQVHDYGEQVRALSLELHIDRLQQEFCLIEEDVLLMTLDVRESPPSLDKSIQQIKGAEVEVHRIIFSRPEGKFYVFGKLPQQNPEIQQEQTNNQE
jgi:hypothetical protein